MLRFIFIILGLITLCTALVINSDILLFIDVASLLFVTVMPLFLTLGFHGPIDLSKAVLSSLIANKLNEQSSFSYQQTLSTLRLTTSASGVIGALIGFVSMLANMDDPSKIGPAMAVSLLTALYAVIISELLIAPMINRLKQITSHKTIAQTSLKPSVITLVSIPLILIMFALLTTFVFED